MTHDEIVAMFDRHRASLEEHDIDALARDYAEDCVLESPMAGGSVQGRDAIARVSRAWIAAFPDVTHRREALLIDGDQVVELERLSGTDKGGFMGLTPSNKSFESCLVRMYTLRDGQIAHERRIYDFTGLLVQIGVLKAKPA
jgi:steroid delta-isomerase-like uncharacterized protein